jgi:pimeloyl-ACP methyl ester carboxylesterase
MLRASCFEAKTARKGAPLRDDNTSGMMESTQTAFTFDDGATTTLERWGNGGPVLLCVHGMVSSRRSWVRLAERFGSRYQIVAYDQRGHGDSADVAGPMSLARGVRDMRAIAAHVRAAFLIGHSWGGAVVIRGGRDLNVEGVVAVDPMLVQVDDDWYAGYIEELDATFALAGAARDARIRENFAQWHAADVQGKVHALHAMTSKPIAGLRDENRDGDWDLRSDIAAYDKPLLLTMAGIDGSINPPDVIGDIAAHHAPSVRLVTFQDQGHNLHRTDFDAFAVEVDEFLRTC